MINLPDGYYGIVPEIPSETDWQIAGNGLDLPRARNSYNGIQYNQNDIQINSCTLHGPIGAVSDLMNYTFTLEERQEIYKRALVLGFDPNLGWQVSKGVDLVCKYWNETHPDDQLQYFRVDFGSPTCTNVINKGYSLVVGYNGNGDYNLDYLKDGVLDQTSFGSPTYGHCIRMHADNTVFDQLIDNYKGSPYEVYNVPLVDLLLLLKNGVYFPSSYVFVPIKEYSNYLTMSNISPWARASVAKAETKGLDESQPQKILTVTDIETAFTKLGLFTSVTGTITEERLAVALDRAKLLG